MLAVRRATGSLESQDGSNPTSRSREQSTPGSGNCCKLSIAESISSMSIFDHSCTSILRTNFLYWLFHLHQSANLLFKWGWISPAASKSSLFGLPCVFSFVFNNVSAALVNNNLQYLKHVYIFIINIHLNLATVVVNIVATAIGEVFIKFVQLKLKESENEYYKSTSGSKSGDRWR